jgi:contractile injection system tape measure protein
MSTSTPHVIRQQYFHVEVNGTESDGMALQRSLPDLCQHLLMPALERVLDRYAPIEGHLIFERIEIDAGTFTLDRLEHDLIESVTQAVEKILREQSPPPGKKPATNVSSNVQLKTDQQSTQDAFVYFLKTGSLPWSFSLPAGRNLEQAVLDSWQDTKKSNIILRAINTTIVHTIASEVARKRLVRQFSPVFMGNMLTRLSPESKQAMDGVLTVLRGSDVSSIEVKHFERQLWETVFAAVAVGNGLTETTLVDEAWRSLPAAKVQLTALANILEHHWPDAIESTFTNQAENIEPAPQKRIKTKKDRRIEPKKERSIIDNQLEAKEASNKTAIKKNKLVKQLSAETPVAEKKKLKDSTQPESKKVSNKDSTKKTESAKKISQEIPATEKRKAKNSKQPELKKTSNKDNTKNTQSAKQLSPETPVAKKKRRKIAEKPGAREIDQSNINARQETEQSIYINSEQNQVNINDPIDLQQGVYIDCAGLVLLHPFLPRFFEALGIVTEDEILQPDRALCLLHYLATGQSIAPEYELILPKILCNVPLEMPVESAMELSSAELEEAAALLEAVIRHWEALRNTSVEGLRGTFLVRPGKVSVREDGDWQLQVESKSFDILLDQLPWGIGTIKLPWMQRMLWVEWAN